MRWKPLFALTLATATLFLSGCAVTPVMPPHGLLFNDQKAPLFPGKEVGTYSGESSSQSILFLVAWGDSSMKAAMEDGQLTSVKGSDYRIENYLLVFQRYTTIAHGERDGGM